VCEIAVGKRDDNVEIIGGKTNTNNEASNIPKNPLVS
jgi:hypothetical protein